MLTEILEQLRNKLLLKIRQKTHEITPATQYEQLPLQLRDHIRNVDMRLVYNKVLNHILEAERILAEAGIVYEEEEAVRIQTGRSLLKELEQCEDETDSTTQIPPD